MKPLSEVNKHSDDILADKFPIDVQIQARIIEKMYNSKDAKELKERVGDRLQIKKAKVTPSKKSQKENIH